MATRVTPAIESHVLPLKEVILRDGEMVSVSTGEATKDQKKTSPLHYCQVFVPFYILPSPLGDMPCLPATSPMSPSPLFSSWDTRLKLGIVVADGLFGKLPPPPLTSMLVVVVVVVVLLLLWWLLFPPSIGC